MSRYYPGFLAALFIVVAADRHRLAFPERRAGESRVDLLERKGAVLGRDLPAQRERSVRAVSSGR